MSDVLDLDALTPKAAIIKLGGQEIELRPPTTADILKLGSLGSKLEDINSLEADEIETAIANVTAHVYKIIPELDGKALNTAQLLVLIQAINDMAMPPDADELKKRGISTDSPKAK